MKVVRVIGLIVAMVAAVALLAACGDDEPSGGNGATATEGADESPTGGAGGDAVVLDIAAENISYDPVELTAPAGADVTLTFDNDDPDIQHNWALFETPESEEAIFEGEIITGVESIDYEFTAPEEPGTYHFHCVIHPSQMEGDFIVE